MIPFSIHATPDGHIRKLREHFSEDNGIQIITLKGKGYHFVVEKG